MSATTVVTTVEQQRRNVDLTPPSPAHISHKMTPTAHAGRTTQELNSASIELENTSRGPRSRDSSDGNEDARVPENAVEAEDGKPLTRDVMLKVLSAGFAFLVAGINDGSLGALIPYLIQGYAISTGFVAISYGCTFAGFLLVALFNSHAMMYFGTGTIIAMGAFLQLLATALRSWMPPYGIFAFSFFFTGAGMALQDAQSNTYVASVRNAHRWLSFIHGMYGTGLLVGPFIATAIAASKPSHWYLFYVFPTGLSCLNILFVLFAFRDLLGLKKRAVESSDEQPDAPSRNTAALAETYRALTTRGLWQLSLFYFFHLGVAITMGGWIVEYLVRVKHGELSKMGYVSAGYYGGFALGRFLLGEPTHRFGERRMLLVYSAGALGLQLIGWLVPGIAASVVAVGIMGFLLGPFFATGMSVASKLFPPDIQPAAIGLVFVFSRIGGAGFPALTGVIAAEAGVQVLQPILVGLTVAMGVSWALVPRVDKRRD